ncbi:MAG: hypothetical protein ACK5LV_07035 [Lachnospirales bacterium]
MRDQSIMLISMILAITVILYVYNNAKAISAYLAGNKTMNVKSSITLNPKKIIEPVGFVLFILFRCGWAKPQNISFYNARNSRKAILITHIAPNVILLISAILLTVFAKYFANSVLFSEFVIQYLLLSIHFVILNLLPINPYDMNSILLYMGSPNTKRFLADNEKLIQMVYVFVLAFNGAYFLITPIATRIANLILWIII